MDESDLLVPSALDLGQRYLLLNARLRRVVDEAMTCGGVSFSRTKVLSLLAQRGPLRQVAIATEFGFAPRSITDLVDGLEREGYAERVDDPMDRRSRLVSITDSGRVALEAAMKIKTDLFEQIFAALNQSGRAELFSLLGTVYASLPSHPSHLGGPSDVR